MNLTLYFELYGFLYNNQYPSSKIFNRNRMQNLFNVLHYIYSDKYIIVRIIMEKINAYTIISETVYVSPSTLVLRAVSEDKPIIIKALKKDYPTSEEVMRFKSEYEITKSLSIPETVRAYTLDKYKNYHAIILENIPYQSLAQVLEQKKKFELKEFIEFAILLAQVIGKIHKHKVIHKDINPSNIM